MSKNIQPRILKELDRLGGNSQLVTTKSPSEFALPSEVELPVSPSWPERRSPYISISGDMLVSLEAENIHPTIMEDWKAFWDLTPNSHIPPPRALALFDEPSGTDVPMIYTPDVPNHQQNSMRNGGFEFGGNFVNGVSTPLALDPVWHSFVEQLGF
jgi:hypothetical protein